MTFIIKPSDSSASSATVVADPHLTVSLDAGKTYRVRMLVIAFAASSREIWHRLSYTGTVTAASGMIHTGYTAGSYSPTTVYVGQSITTESLTNEASFIEVSGTGAGRRHVARVEAVIKTNSSGTLVWKFRQGTTDPANPVYIYADSTMSVEEIGSERARSAIYKSSNTDRTNTSTRTNDPDLAVVLSANKHYLLEMLLVTSGITITMHLVPDGTLATTIGTAVRSDDAAAATATSIYGPRWADYCWDINIGTVSTASLTVYETLSILAYVVVGGSDVTVRLSWAQNSPSADTTRVCAGSYFATEDVTP